MGLDAAEQAAGADNKIGSRMKIAYTRAMIRAALSGMNHARKRHAHMKLGLIVIAMRQHGPHIAKILARQALAQLQPAPLQRLSPPRPSAPGPAPAGMSITWCCQVVSTDTPISSSQPCSAARHQPASRGPRCSHSSTSSKAEATISSKLGKEMVIRC